MRKIVYNQCYGGFRLSDLAREKLAEKKGIHLSDLPYDSGFDRADPDLVAVVEELGEKASTSLSNLKIEEVEGQYRIVEYDGFETVETPESIKWS